MTSTAVIWSKSKPDVEFQYGERLGEFHGMSSRSHVSHCRVLPLGEFTVMIPKPRLCHVAGCNNSIRHIENRFSPYFIYFLMQFGLWREAAFVSSPIHLLIEAAMKELLKLIYMFSSYHKDKMTLFTVYVRRIRNTSIGNMGCMGPCADCSWA